MHRSATARVRFLWRPEVWDANMSATYSSWFHEAEPLPALRVHGGGMWPLKRDASPAAMVTLETELDTLLQQWVRMGVDPTRHRVYWVPVGAVEYAKLHPARRPLTPARVGTWDAKAAAMLARTFPHRPGAQGVYYAAAVRDIYEGMHEIWRFFYILICCTVP